MFDLLKAEDRRKAGMVASKSALWQTSPEAFVREVCGDTPDPWQMDALKALRTETRLALKACKGPGKTRFLAWVAWWWMFTRPHCNIVCMSITEDNLRDNLWSELARVQQQSDLLKEFFSLRSQRIVAKAQASKDSAEQTWWCSARSFPQNADKTQQANTIAGMHGKFPMVLCDEVGDYPDGVVVAAEGIFANDVDAKLVIVGNPTNMDGPLYRVKDNPRWWNKSITGDPDDPLRAPRISKEWARAAIAEWGRWNPWVLVNVFGEFPPVQSDKLLGHGDIRAAVMRTIAPERLKEEPLIFGLDVARYGDNESVLFKRRGAMVYPPRCWRETDLMTLAGQVMIEVAAEGPDAVFVDGSGVGGGVVDRLRQLGAKVIDVDFGGKPNDSKFKNLRSEMYWKLAADTRTRLCLPADDQLAKELVAPTYTYVVTGRQTLFRMETKEEMKKRGVPSPDRSDALALTYAAPVLYTPTLMQLPGPSAMGTHKINHLVGGTGDGEWDPFA